MPQDIRSFLERPLLDELGLEIGPESPRVNTWYLEDVLSHRSFGDGGMINCQKQAPAKARFVDRFAEVLWSGGLGRREEWDVASNTGAKTKRRGGGNQLRGM